MSSELLDYTDDIRQELTSGRRANFKQGWTRAVEGKEYDGDETLDVLTWNNLGWRLGKIFGDVPDEMRDSMIDWCERQHSFSDQ
ncbi:hypothetical protein C2R22_15655 [Salinigranum rubrum]|uniref:Uncharacterized protein n=1 Tax=Salinigranum rubrum TaxID=755307 RepID=A0A2I8VLU5_9EURY|nr:hypothetical protein C2R22_15655 [Salinigranum rubrum]